MGCRRRRPDSQSCRRFPTRLGNHESVYAVEKKPRALGILSVPNAPLHCQCFEEFGHEWKDEDASDRLNSHKLAVEVWFKMGLHLQRINHSAVTVLPSPDPRVCPTGVVAARGNSGSHRLSRSPRSTGCKAHSAGAECTLRGCPLPSNQGARHHQYNFRPNCTVRGMFS